MLRLLSSNQSTPIVTTLNFDAYITKVSPLSASRKPVTQMSLLYTGGRDTPTAGSMAKLGPIASKSRNINLGQSTFAQHEVPLATPVVMVPAKPSFFLYPRIRGWQINSHTLHRNRAPQREITVNLFPVRSQCIQSRNQTK